MIGCAERILEGKEMALPTHPVLHRSILEIAAEAKVTVSARQILDSLTVKLSLSQDNLDERTSTGASRIKANIGFGVSYLARAGLLRRPARGQYEITDEGRSILRQPDVVLSFTYLTRLIEGEARVGQKETPDAPVKSSKVEDSREVYPHEKIDEGYKALRENLKSELLASLLNMTPKVFEHFVGKFLEKLGYGKSTVVGRSGDDGIDVIIYQDALGLERVYVQAKRWQQQIPVRSPDIQRFSGSLHYHGAVKGIFVTTSTFTKGARKMLEGYSRTSQNLQLIDGDTLAELMIDHDVGVATQHSFVIKKIDEDFFEQM